MGFRHTGWHISMCTLDRNDRRDVQKVVQMYVRELPEGGTKATQEGAARSGDQPDRCSRWPWQNAAEPLLERITAESPSIAADRIAARSGIHEQCEMTLENVERSAPIIVKDTAPDATDNTTAPPSSIIASARHSAFRLMIASSMTKLNVVAWRPKATQSTRRATRAYGTAGSGHGLGWRAALPHTGDGKLHTLQADLKP